MATGTGDATLQALTGDGLGYFAPERSGTGDITLSGFSADGVGHISFDSTGTGNAVMAGFQSVSRGYFADAQVSAHLVWVKEGTVDVTNGSNVVSGTGTSWISAAIALRAGDIFTIDGSKLYEIAIVTNNNTMLLVDNYGEATQSGITYSAIRMAHVHSKLVADQINIVTKALTREQELKDWETLVYNPTVPATVDITRYDGTMVTLKTLPQILGEMQAIVDLGSVGPAGANGAAGPAGPGFQWEGPWLITTVYTADDTVERGGSSYICIADHTSTANDEPGVGVNTATYWQLAAAKGQTGATGPAGGVTSVFSRVGIISAAADDYSATQITNTSGVSGSHVKDALDWLNTNKSSVGHAHGLDNLSDVSIGSAQSGQAIMHNGSSWANRALIQGDVLNLESDIASLQSQINAGAIGTLQGLSDVSFPDPYGLFFSGVLVEVVLGAGNISVSRAASPVEDSWATSFWQKSSGQHYIEFTITTAQTPASIRLGLRPDQQGTFEYSDTIMASLSGVKWEDGSNVGSITGGSFVATDVMSIAVDFDSGKMWIGKNGTWLESGDPAAGTGAQFTWTPNSADYHLAAWFIDDDSSANIGINQSPEYFIAFGFDNSTNFIEEGQILAWNNLSKIFQSRFIASSEVAGLDAALATIPTKTVDLSDIQLTSPSSGDRLEYVAFGQKWINVPVDYYTQAASDAKYSLLGQHHAGENVQVNSIQAASGTVGAPAHTFQGETDSGSWFQGGTIRTALAGLERFSISNTGIIAGDSASDHGSLTWGTGFARLGYGAPASAAGYIDLEDDRLKIGLYPNPVAEVWNDAVSRVFEIKDGTFLLPDAGISTKLASLTFSSAAKNYGFGFDSVNNEVDFIANNLVVASVTDTYLSMNSNRIRDVAEPALSTDVATKSYVDTADIGNVDHSTVTMNVAGTASEIDVTGGVQDISASRTWTVGLTDNPTIPGLEGLVLPQGTTAQRGATTAGIMRFNTSDSVPEVYTGSAWLQLGAGGGGVVPKRAEFTSGGTWTRPAGVDFVDVICVGAGGGGGGGSRNSSGSFFKGGGGGGGGGQIRYARAVPVTGNVTVTIGAGGSGGAKAPSNATDGSNGTNGGNSSFGSLVSKGGTLGGLGEQASDPDITSGNGGAGGGNNTFVGLNTEVTVSEWKGSNLNVGGPFGTPGANGGDGGFSDGDKNRERGLPGQSIGGSKGGDSPGGTGAEGGGGGGGAGFHPNGESEGGAGGDGNDGTGYGSGGGGGDGHSTAPGDGGDGTAGIIIVLWWE